jgi:hypothetical protein
MVMIGYEADTKAYRAYNSVNKKLVVTRDVIFDEKKSWNWSSTELVEPISNEIFTVVYSDLYADDQNTGSDIDKNTEDAPSPSARMASGAGTQGRGAGSPCTDESASSVRPGASAHPPDSPRGSISSQPARPDSRGLAQARSLAQDGGQLRGPRWPEREPAGAPARGNQPSRPGRSEPGG